ncbi:MAG: peroxiredoxin family protein [Synechococcales bacterium]|nr:peroxiredoxin family protein [Synechococcales bacterium]
MLTSNDFSGLVNGRFMRNLFPIPAQNQIQIGDLAPPFQLYDVLNRQQRRLADWVGMVPGDDLNTVGRSPVLLAFTRIFTEKQYCPLCFPHIGALNEAYEQFRQRGVEVWMITSTDPEQSAVVVQDLGLKMPLLSDPACRTFRAYQTGQALGAPLPAQFLVDAGGRVRYRHLFSFLEPNASMEMLLEAIAPNG